MVVNWNQEFIYFVGRLCVVHEYWITILGIKTRPMTSGLMHSHKADALSLLTHFNLDLKYNHCMQQEPMQGRVTRRN